MTAKLGWIDNMLNQGDIAGAIKEYRTLAKQEPDVSSHFSSSLDLAESAAARVAA